MSRPLRIALLLLVLASVGLGLWTERARLARWRDPVWVAVYPIAAGDGDVAAFVERLQPRHLQPIEAFLARAAAEHDLATQQPVEMRLAPAVTARPPAPPADGGVLAAMFWSLRIRYWAWRHDTYDGPEEIRIFVQYHDPERTRRLAHSVGLEKARIGLVNAFGDRRYRGRNHVVIAHELLHTLGASDKYDRATGEPTHPHGYADPDREPLHPQRRAELMGARIPLGTGRSRMPRTLAETVIGPLTAAELGWRGPP